VIEVETGRYIRFDARLSLNREMADERSKRARLFRRVATSITMWWWIVAADLGWMQGGVRIVFLSTGGTWILHQLGRLLEFNL